MARTRRRRPTQPPPTRLVLDSGAVIALSRNDVRARAVLAAAWEAEAEVFIPSVVLAETVRGSTPPALVNRVVRAVGEICVADEATGRLAGCLLGSAESTSSVDALVVANAIGLGGGVILTGVPQDLGALAGEHPAVEIHAL